MSLQKEELQQLDAMARRYLANSLKVSSWCTKIVEVLTARGIKHELEVDRDGPSIYVNFPVDLEVECDGERVVDYSFLAQNSWLVFSTYADNDTVKEASIENPNEQQLEEFVTAMLSEIFPS